MYVSDKAAVKPPLRFTNIDILGEQGMCVDVQSWGDKPSLSLESDRTILRYLFLR